MNHFFRRPLLVLLTLAGLLYFYKLGGFSLYDAAETTYGEFVKGILTTGDWLTLHFNGEIIFDKPPLYYWLVALLSKIVGFNEWAMRFWAALSGVLTVAVTYLLAKTLYNQRTGFFSALIVMTAFQFLIQSRIAELDIVLTLCVATTLLCFVLGYRGERKYYLLAYLPMGLALLVKGLLGAALPLSTIFLFLLAKQELSKIKNMFPVSGLLIMLSIGLPWYLAEYLIHGQVFLDFAFGFLFLSRFGQAVSSHTGPWYYYLPAILIGFAPWSQFLPLAFWQSIKKWKNDPELLSLCLIVPTLLVFTLAKTKLPSYILPLYPFFGLMVARCWDDYLNQREPRRPMFWSVLSYAVIVGLIAVGSFMAAQNYPGEYAQLVPTLQLLLAVLAIGAVATITFYALKRYSLTLYSIPATVFVFAFILISVALPQVEPLKGTKELAQSVTQLLKPTDLIAAYDIGNRPGVIFYNVRPVRLLSSEAEVRYFLKHKQGYLFTQKSNLIKLIGNKKESLPAFCSKGELAVLK